MTQELIDLALKLWPLFEKILALKTATPAITEADLRAELIKDADALGQKIQDDLDSHPPTT